MNSRQHRAAIEAKRFIVAPAERRALLDLIDERNRPRFQSTSCSQCGCEFGPGNAGYSDCREHRTAAELQAIRDHHDDEYRTGLDRVGEPWERDDRRIRGADE